MPTKGLRICGCGKTAPSGQMCPCEQRRARERKARHDQRRPSARQRGYTAEWERESKAFLQLANNRLCCCGCGRIANMVDHKIRHGGDTTLFWDRSNWQPMNSHCHNSRKQSEERRQKKDF